MTPTNTMRRMIVDDDIPMKEIKALAGKLQAMTAYLMDTSLGSLDERILLRDTTACLIALGALDFRDERVFT